MRTTGVVLVLLFSSSVASAADKVPRYVVDDFEGAERVSASGAAWAPLTDAVLGGASTMRLSIVGAKGKRALRAEGTIAEKGFAGTWVALDEGARAVDLTAFRAVRLKLRGAGGWQVGLRAGVSPSMDNFMAPVTGSDGWTNVEVPLAVLRNRKESAPDLAEARWLGIQAAAGRTGPFAFEVDDVELVGASRPASPHGARMQSRVKKAALGALASATWAELGTDPVGDGKAASLPDIVSLASVRQGDTVWFRLTTAAPVGEAFGVNLVFDTGSEPAKTRPWWGSNTGFKFERLVTAWVFATTADGFEGTIGISSAEDAMKGAMIDDALGAPQLAVSADGRQIYVGVPRAALGGGSRPVRLLAAVGSPMKHNDDLPDTGALTMTP
jgi:hypothetical protein